MHKTILFLPFLGRVSYAGYPSGSRVQVIDPADQLTPAGLLDEGSSAWRRSTELRRCNIVEKFKYTNQEDVES